MSLHPTEGCIVIYKQLYTSRLSSSFLFPPRIVFLQILRTLQLAFRNASCVLVRCSPAGIKGRVNTLPHRIYTRFAHPHSFPGRAHGPRPTPHPLSAGREAGEAQPHPPPGKGISWATGSCSWQVWKPRPLWAAARPLRRSLSGTAGAPRPGPPAGLAQPAPGPDGPAAAPGPAAGGTLRAAPARTARPGPARRGAPHHGGGAVPVLSGTLPAPCSRLRANSRGPARCAAVTAATGGAAGRPGRAGGRGRGRGHGSGCRESSAASSALPAPSRSPGLVGARAAAAPQGGGGLTAPAASGAAPPGAGAGALQLQPLKMEPRVLGHRRHAELLRENTQQSSARPP